MFFTGVIHDIIIYIAMWCGEIPPSKFLKKTDNAKQKKKKVIIEITA